MHLEARIGLCERLKRETRELHVSAERSGVMGDLVQGKVDRAAYCALLRNLHAVYDSLEKALGQDAVGDWLKPLWPALRRVPSLTNDLQALYGASWREQIAIESAAEKYSERINTLGRSGSPALVAHTYVRYLGDLHGGQILSGIVRERFQLTDQSGTEFYAFGPPARVHELRTSLRSSLDSLDFDSLAVEAIATEARWAFEMHRLLFEQIASRYSTPIEQSF